MRSLPRSAGLSDRPSNSWLCPLPNPMKGVWSLRPKRRAIYNLPKEPPRLSEGFRPIRAGARGKAATRNKPSLSVKTDWAVTEAGVKSNSSRVYTPDRTSNLSLANGRVNPLSGSLEQSAELRTFRTRRREGVWKTIFVKKSQGRSQLRPRNRPHH
jgi:hypothetical protein